MAPGEPTNDVMNRESAFRMPPWAGPAEPWPLQSFLEFNAEPSQVPVARQHARRTLLAWGVPDLRDDAELLLSEMITNAVAISALDDQPDIRLWLFSDGRQVVILVWDASPSPPAIADPVTDAESGRGLLLVDALSREWGWHFTADVKGKVVWAALAGEL